MMLKSSLENQLAQDNKDLDSTKTAKADAEETKATAEGDLSETVEDIKVSNEQLETVSTDCMTGATDHETSTKARAEELAVIAKAKEIIQESVGGATSKVYSLFQVDSATGVRSKVQTRVDLANLEIVAIVKKLARAHHSSALAQLASRISAVTRFGAANGEDIFAKVKSLITDMIAKLQKDAAAEADQKAYCDEETAKTESTKSDLTADI